MTKLIDPRSRKLAKIVNSDPRLSKLFYDNYGLGSGVDRTIEDYLNEYSHRPDIAYYLAGDLGIDQKTRDTLL